MDLKKTGAFIQEQRKKKKLTQIELATRLCISEKTISKWECGKGFPDTSLILPLCTELDITANELLSAQQLKSEQEYKTNAENNLLHLTNQDQRKNKMLLSLELVLVYMSIIFLLGCCIAASYLNIATVWRILLIAFGFVNCILGVVWSLKIEKDAGYYECKHCKHKYIPTYRQILWSIHMGRTRYMKCPNCNKPSWNKKTTSLN